MLLLADHLKTLGHFFLQSEDLLLKLVYNRFVVLSVLLFLGLEASQNVLVLVSDGDVASELVAVELIELAISLALVFLLPFRFLPRF